MATHGSFDAIEKEIERRCRIALFNVRERIYGILYKNLRRYYLEYDPAFYKRTHQLLDSLVRVTSDNGLKIEVYFDESSFHYKKRRVELLNGMRVSATWGAKEVLDTAMHGSHGGWTGSRYTLKHPNNINGGKIWDDSLAEIGDVRQLVKEELIKAGVPIK